MPRGAWRIYTAVWGMAIALFAIMCIGGVKSEMIFRKIDIEESAPSEVELDAEPEVLVENPIKFREKVEVEEEMPLDIESPLSCQVYGFMSDGSETSVSRLLVCGVVRGELKHVGIVDAGKLKSRSREKLRGYLNSNLREQPLVDSMYRATWVKPVVAVVVEFDGWSPNDEMVDPEISSISRAESTSGQSPQQPESEETTEPSANPEESPEPASVESALAE